jgi:D-alanyl-D-alanine carboxypeptidase
LRFIFSQMLRIVSFFSLLTLSFISSQAQTELKSYLEAVPYAEEQRVFIHEFAMGFQAPEVVETPAEETIEAWRTWETVENYMFGKDRGGLPMIADLDALHPYFRDKIALLISTCNSKGIDLAIVESYRTHTKQNEYKSMGKKYTRSGGGHSKHQYGLAVDVVPVIDSVAQWDNIKLWRKVGAIGEQLGLRWGGRWRNPYDPGHFEWTGGLSSYHLSAGLKPRVPKSDKYACLEEELNKLEESWKAWETEQSAITRKQIVSSKMN